MGFHEYAVLYLFQCLELLWVRQCCLVFLSIVAVTLGATGVLAFLWDALRLLHVHLEILSLAFRGVFRAELYLLAALWRVFRGKKRNVLRNRTDSMQYDSIQLLLGSILFAVTLFLFTTVLVYHVFFSLCHLAVAVTLNLLRAAILCLREWPAGVIVTRSLYRQWYAKDFYLVENCSGDPSISVTTLFPVMDTLFVSVLENGSSLVVKLVTLAISQVRLTMFCLVTKKVHRV